MGYYINPPDISKEDFLLNHGKVIKTAAEIMTLDFKTSYPVCLVQNDGFTAAGIAYDQHEAKVFLHPDPRERVWFEVSAENLAPYLPKPKSA